MKNLFKKIALTLSLILVTVSIPTFATTITNKNLSKEEINNLRKTFIEDGIPIEIQDELIEKKNNGELWDVEIPEKFNSIPDDFFQSLAYKNEIKYTFEDGSYLLLKNEQPEIHRNMRSYYERNIPRATVSASYGGNRAQIYANISMYYGEQGKIHSVEPTGYFYAANGYLVSDPSPYISKDSGNNGNPATAKYLPKITRPNIVGANKTVTLEYTMYVNGKTYWATLKQY